MFTRPTIRDNLATRDCPVWRYRYMTPLTPRAVRSEIAKSLASMSEHERKAEYDRQLTWLDKALSDDEANALQQYVDCELILQGNARCGDYAGDRVQSSRTTMTPIHDDVIVKLAKHHRIKMMLSLHDRRILGAFVMQFTETGMSDAQCAMMFGLPGKRKNVAWLECVKGVGERLALL